MRKRKFIKNAKCSAMVGRMKKLPEKSRFKSIKDACFALGEIPSINCGGCGIAAYFIEKECLKRKLKPEIVFMLHHSDKPNEKKPFAPRHALVKVGNRYYDARGEHNEPGWGGVETIVSEKYLLRSIKNKNSWNDEFDREEYVPEIEKKFGFNLAA